MRYIVVAQFTKDMHTMIIVRNVTISCRFHTSLAAFQGGQDASEGHL